MKKIFSLFLVLLMIVSVIPITAVAATETLEYAIDGVVYEVQPYYGTPTAREESYKIIKANNYGITREIIIPEEINGWPVTRIGKLAFWFDDLDKIVISNTVTHIEEDAFHDLDVGEIILSDSVISMDNCFQYSNVGKLHIGSGLEGCGHFYDSNIDEITVSPDNKYFYTTDDGSLFYKGETNVVLKRYMGKDSTRYVVPFDTTVIGSYAFYNHDELKEIALNGNQKRFLEYAFLDCDNLEEIGGLVFCEAYISTGVFAGCDSLKNIFISEKATYISSGAFNGWTSEENPHYYGSYKNLKLESSGAPTSIAKTLHIITEDTSEITCKTSGFKNAWRCDTCAKWAERNAEFEQHDYYKTNASVSSTCVFQGSAYYKCRICEDGEYRDLPLADHKDRNHDGICDQNGCGYDFTEGCAHICHKGGFFYKFSLFFWKIFKIQKECGCGMYHY